MKQLAQKLKTGEMSVLEVAEPLLSAGMVLVRNHYSVISAGTERSTVKTARKSLVGKARERPQQVKQVLDVLAQQGPVQTYRAVMKKLDSHSPLGYSCAGEVIAVAPEVRGFTPGDLVACGGIGYANHAEIVAVPVNLCVNLPAGSDLKNAAYNTLGSIALQGIRQADLRLGESCVVIGLGLIGQLTCLMLRAAGVKVIGIDIDPWAADIASQNCADVSMTRDEPGLEDRVDEATSGIGADAAIITAATSSTDPVNLAGRLLRKKGTVVVVGDVPTGFDRDPYYYRKELELRMSCSYGPGRYDLAYEEKGLDYPVGHVRWTENRNMQAFQDMLNSSRIDIGYLTTHVFDLEGAPEAYDLILNRNEPLLGILLRYDTKKRASLPRIPARPTRSRASVNIAFIGAGSYAMSHLLPNIPSNKAIALKGILTAAGTNTKTVADRYGFEFCTAIEEEILDAEDIDTVFVATWHNSHAEYVSKCLRAGKNVFVEKPLALTLEQLEEIREAYESKLAGRTAPAAMVGYNRRFSPLTEIARSRLGTGPMSMIYRINAGPIPPGTWIQDRDIGGGRIIGEVCHFIDYLMFICGSRPLKVFTVAMSDPQNQEDTITISLAFENGSIGSISYFANGAKSLPKEYIELHRAGNTAIIRDFKEIEVLGTGKPYRKKLLAQNKGQKAMISRFLDAIRTGNPTPITFEELYLGTRATLKATESLRTGETISLH